MSLRRHFALSLERLRLPPGPVLAAISGGADSVALLDLLVATRPNHGHGVIVAHADHGISPDSAEVARRVEALAVGYGLPFVLGSLALGSLAGETTARKARYEWLERSRRETGARTILTAHHADDQVETVMMRVLAGSGPSGLAGMLPWHGLVARPLLPFRRERLVRYVQRRGLEFWNDPANREHRHLRAWVRHALLPLVEERLPLAGERLLRLSGQARLNREAWDALLDSYSELDWRREDQISSVAASALRAYDSPLALSLLMAVARRAGMVLGPSRARRVFAFANRGQSGGRLELGSGWTAELAFDRLRLLPPDQPVNSSGTNIEGEAGRTQWGQWGIDWKVELAPERQARDAMTAWFIPGSVTVRAWKAGDRIVPLRGAGHRPLVRCFQEARIPRTERTRWPVFNDCEGNVLWVPGVCRSDAGVPVPGAEALRVDVVHD
jgi:tRNA(Ile)-lysidine synthase